LRQVPIFSTPALGIVSVSKVLGVGTMAAIQRISVEDIVDYFDELEDPRTSINIKHPLVSVVVVAMMGVLAGANGPTAIARWAKLKEAFLRQALPLPHGVPCKDVFRGVLSLLKPEAFQTCFAAWLNSLRRTAEARAAQADQAIDKPIFAIDGKTSRRSHDHAKGLGALHTVSVWASDFGLSLGQVACAEKSNEITAIPELLRMVDIQGTIITIDALGTQKAIAAQIVEGEADYVLALKGNQETLHEEVIDYIDEQAKDGFATCQARQHLTNETGHGREEIRSYVQMPVPKDLPTLELWKGLKSIGMATLVCVRDGKETIETRYYISSLNVGVKQFARAIRSHWGIENGCHWSLDMIYRDDESRIRVPNLRENFAWLNRFTLSLLKQHPDKKQSTVMKRRSCGWSDDFLLEVITGTTA
jgi:predicted transposase YbfD/YdcC